MARPLLKLEEAAQQLRVPKGSLRTAAENLGFLIRMGRALRIDPDSLEELVKACRVRPRERASTSAETPGSGSSATPGAATDQQAQEIAERLKQRSRRTSPSAAGPSEVLRFRKK